MSEQTKVYFRGANGYMMSACGSYEHRDVWEAAHGPIPSNCHIHHRNRVRHDNRLENLECIEATQHLKMHGLTWRMVNHLRRLREKRPERKFACVQCGREATSQHPLAQFCSVQCCKKHHNEKLTERRSAARSAARGQGTCPVCGVRFVRSRRFQRFCARRCAHVAAMRRYNAKIGFSPTPSMYHA
jgi:hypothetical protein